MELRPVPAMVTIVPPTPLPPQRAFPVASVVVVVDPEVLLK